MKVSLHLVSILIVLFCALPYAYAEEEAEEDDGGGDDGGGDDGGGDDDPNQLYYNYYDEGADDQQPDDYIKYWSEYAILPKRCIVYNNVDVIVFQMFLHGYKQCSDTPMGTYVIPVPNYVDAYMSQLESDQSDQGYDDYEIPEAAQYSACTGVQVQGNQYYVQTGCADGNTQGIAANIYTDATCETRVEDDGEDDSTIDLSEIQVPFKKCKQCVVWVDKNDDEIDDMFYENRRREAPLCSQVWSYKQECNRKCQKIGAERVSKEGWNTSDKVLLCVLSVFGCTMLVAILRKRQKMSNKDALLEQAAMSAAGLQQMHVVAIFVLCLVIIIIFASLRMKAITWCMLLIFVVLLFAYLMKLTVDSGVEEGDIINPDGTITRIDSDDSSIASHVSGGLPPIS